MYVSPCAESMNQSIHSSISKLTAFVDPSASLALTHSLTHSLTHARTHAITHSPIRLLLENQVVNGTCTNLLNIKQPSFSDLNHVIGLHLASAFLPPPPPPPPSGPPLLPHRRRTPRGSGGGEGGVLRVEKLHWQAVVLAVEKI